MVEPVVCVPSSWSLCRSPGRARETWRSHSRPHRSPSRSGPGPHSPARTGHAPATARVRHARPHRRGAVMNSDRAVGLRSSRQQHVVGATHKLVVRTGLRSPPRRRSRCPRWTPRWYGRSCWSRSPSEHICRQPAQSRRRSRRPASWPWPCRTGSNRHNNDGAVGRGRAFQRQHFAVGTPSPTTPVSGDHDVITAAAGADVDVVEPVVVVVVVVVAASFAEVRVASTVTPSLVLPV